MTDTAMNDARVGLEMLAYIDNTPEIKRRYIALCEEEAATLAPTWTFSKVVRAFWGNFVSEESEEPRPMDFP